MKLFYKIGSWCRFGLNKIFLSLKKFLLPMNSPPKSVVTSVIGDSMESKIDMRFRLTTGADFDTKGLAQIFHEKASMTQRKHVKVLNFFKNPISISSNCPNEYT